MDAAMAWTIAYMRGSAVAHPPATATMTSVDLFCGAGGLTYGLCEAARSVGVRLRPRLAIDLDASGLEIYQRNISVDAPLTREIRRILDYHIQGSGMEARFAYRPKIVDPLVADLSHEVDFVVAGPPCEGHSNFNNKTRRADRRNLLYLAAPAFAIACRARGLIIENVPDVLNDKHNVVASARALLAKGGYSISEAVLHATRFGLAQTRRRHFLVAIRNPRTEFQLAKLVAGLEVPPLAVGHILADLVGSEGRTFFHSAAKLSTENQRRIDWLFSKNKDDLPNHVRPRCHQNGHTYKSVYGRLKWKEPSGTITTGFLTPGRGRYVHPKERRGLTPHEGARLQGFPDSFSFVDGSSRSSKKALSKVIGDAVPPPLGYAVGLAAFALTRP
jgi:DNA (cytosine-5)-methyltransferase 1